MAIESRAEVVFKGGMKFDGRSGRAGTAVALDFAREGEAIEGYTPMELLLSSLAGCSGQVTVGLLKRMGQEVEGLTVHARGPRRRSTRRSSHRSSSISSSAAVSSMPLL